MRGGPGQVPPTPPDAPCGRFTACFTASRGWWAGWVAWTASGGPYGAARTGAGGGINKCKNPREFPGVFYCFLENGRKLLPGHSLRSR